MVNVVELKPLHVVSVGRESLGGIEAALELGHHEEVLASLAGAEPAVLDSLPDAWREDAEGAAWWLGGVAVF